MIVVITITCNRLELTKEWLFQLKEKAGYPFKHIIVDNGSNDGTVQWLLSQGYTVISLSKNIGILKAWKRGIQYAKKFNPDFIIKFDNDCEIHSDNVLKEIMNFYNNGCDSYVSAPLDTMILEKQMPKEFKSCKERGYNLRYTTHTGGIFQVIPIRAAEMLLNASEKEVGGDLLRGRFWIKNGYDIVYFTDLKISHRGIGKQTKNYRLA